MNKILFSIRDNKSGVFGPPMVALTVGEARRTLINLHMDKKDLGDLSRFPSDFEMMNLGEFDETTGVIIPQNPPSRIMLNIEAVHLAEGIYNSTNVKSTLKEKPNSLNDITPVNIDQLRAFGGQ